MSKKKKRGGSPFNRSLYKQEPLWRVFLKPEIIIALILFALADGYLYHKEHYSEEEEHLKGDCTVLKSEE